MDVFRHASRLRRRRPSRGQSLVEFALVAPLLLLFLAMVLDLGRIYYANISLLNAAREGAFQASKTPESFVSGADCDADTNLIVCRVQLESAGSMVEIASADIDVDCSKPGCPLESDSTVTVSVEGEFRLLTPVLAFFFGGQVIDLDTSATTQIEYFPPDGVATVPPTPVAAFTATDTSGEAPIAITFDATTSSGSPTDWLWDFGDGGIAAGSAQVTHTYTTPGNYTVTLRVINLAGDDEATMSIQIDAPPPPPSPSPSPTPAGTPTPTPSPTPTPEVCAYPPNVVGSNPTQAATALGIAGWTFQQYADLVTGTKGKIQAQSPDHNLCSMKSTTTVITHYRPN